MFEHSLELAHISVDDPQLPNTLTHRLGERAPKRITVLGNLDILRRPLTALFCSVKCPGDLILRTYDLAQALRQAGVAVISGFHSPMERECLTILLRGTQPVVVCPARSIKRMRMRIEHRKPLEEGRLLFLSPFTEADRRVTRETALYRNRIVAALAERVVVAYAEPNGKTETFCREILGWGKPLYTVESDANAHLIELGAQAMTPAQMILHLNTAPRMTTEQDDPI